MHLPLPVILTSHPSIPPMKPIHLPRPKGPRGFSLVEVTLALGIAALGIIAVLGLMPQGLEMSRKTGEMTAHKQITQQIVSDLEQRNWASLATAGSVITEYYDDQGAKTTSSSPTQAFIAKYQVQPLTGGASLPLGSSSEPFLRKAVVKIATTTNPNFDFTDNNRRNYVTVIHYIAKAR